MATNSITIPVQYRKCVNEKSTGYGKYYGEVRNKRPLSMMGFCNHMKMHGLAYRKEKMTITRRNKKASVTGSLFISSKH